MSSREEPALRDGGGLTTSADRTMAVLEFLARRTYPTPTMVIAEECGIPKSSLHNLLNTMLARRFVSYHRAERAWSLGPRLYEIGGDAPLLAHALAIIRVFDDDPGPHDLRTLVQRSGLPQSTVNRMTPMLEEHGLLSRTAGDHYRLGLLFVALASRVGSLDQLRLLARPILTRLRDETGETANLVALLNDHALYVDQVESRHALRHAGWLGRQIPLDSTATGAALLGAEGIQVARDSVEPGVTAVACRIPGTLDPPAIVSIIGPSFRLQDRDLARARSAVEQAAHMVETALARTRALRDPVGFGVHERGRG